MTLIWPKILVPCVPDIFYDARTVSGGISLTGKEQVAARDFGIWRGSLGQIPIQRRSQVLALNALLAQLDGRSGTVMVPLFDALRAPWAVDAYGRTLDPTTARRLASYKGSPGSLYGEPTDFIEGLIAARLTVGAAARAATVSINMIKGSIPEPGMHFQLGECAYRIREIVSVVGSVVTVLIRPGLRAAAVAAAPVNFTSPAIKMRLASDDQGRAPLNLWRTAVISLDFIEA